jgi:hypothetical protein
MTKRKGPRKPVVAKPPGKPASLSRELVRARFDTELLHIDLDVDPAGTLNLSSWDCGLLAELFMGDSDYERGIRLFLPGIEALCIQLRGELPEGPTLWLADVLTTMYTGDHKAVDRFIGLCDRLSIPYERWAY